MKMKNIISFICFIVICIGLSSCSVYTTDDYVYTRTVYYPSYSIYHKPIPPRHYHPKPQHKPKHHYNKSSKPTHKHHHSRPIHNRKNNRH